MSAAIKQKNTVYYLHIVIFLFITFGFGFLPPFAQITPVGMKVLGAFLGAVYGGLFIALDWPSLIALIALGISGYASSYQELFMSGWTFQSVSQSLLAYLFAEALARTSFTSYISNKLLSIKLFKGRPYVLMIGCMIAAEVMFALHCGMAGLFLLWSMFKVMAEKAGYEKTNKFTMIMVPSVLMVFIFMGFLFPFNAGSVVMIGLFQKGMGGLEVSFGGWIGWWLIYTNVYIVLWTLFVKYVLRIKYPEIAAIGEEIAALGDGKQKMTGEQKFGLAILVGFMVGMFIPNILPEAWALTGICKALGLTGMLCLALCIMCACRTAKGEAFITMQGVSKGIVWNILWLLIATEPLANAFNAEACGIMPSIMAGITPILTNMSSTFFLVAVLLILGIITQVVHNFVLMVVFIPLLCPMYVGMGGNPFVMFMGLMLILNCALATPAASYTSALMFGEESMDKKAAYIQGFAHFVFALVLFLIVGLPMASICFPY